jgi:uncharacterized membrane protein SpoIIM required for sporulation
MKETRFIAQNKQKWQEAEMLLERHQKDPEKLGNLFVQVVDDLSYSRTYYPNRSVRVYLNKIARQYFSIIYSHRKDKHNRFKIFWLDELPQIILYSRRELWISFLIFMLAMLIGVFSSHNDPQFVNSILGSDYVEMTEKNIANDDPMAVYKREGQTDMFLAITFNNLMVAFRTYVLGIFLGIGTLGSLLSNGVMVGSFQYFFIQRGLGVESASTIWLHGTLEISSIILAGAAGLTLARGLIFPETYSRLQSLQISGMRSLKFMLGIAPVFVLAAIIESFLTRYTDAPPLLKFTLIFLSAAFIVGYFIVYPWMKSKSGFLVPLKEIRLQPYRHEEIDTTRIKSNADIVKETFQFYSRQAATIFQWVFLVSIVVGLSNIFFTENQSIIFEEDWFVSLFSNLTFGLHTPTAASIALNTIGLSIVLYRVMMLLDAELNKRPFTYEIKSFLQLLVISTIIYVAIYIGTLGVLFAFAAFGILFVAGFIGLTERQDLYYGFTKAWGFFGKNNNQGIGLQFIVMLLSFSLLTLMTAPLLYIHITVVKWNFVSTSVWSQKFIEFLEIFLKTISFYMVLSIGIVSFSLLYFSQKEVVSATHLKSTIAKMGSRISKNKR